MTGPLITVSVTSELSVVTICPRAFSTSTTTLMLPSTKPALGCPPMTSSDGASSSTVIVAELVAEPIDPTTVADPSTPGELNNPPLVIVPTLPACNVQVIVGGEAIVPPNWS